MSLNLLRKINKIENGSSIKIKTSSDTEINNKIKSGKKVTQWYGGPL